MNFESIRNVIAETLGCDVEQVTLEAELHKDLGADSLAAAELMMALEEATGVTIADEDIPSMKTVGSIVDYLNARA